MIALCNDRTGPPAATETLPHCGALSAALPDELGFGALSTPTTGRGLEKAGVGARARSPSEGTRSADRAERDLFRASGGCRSLLQENRSCSETCSGRQSSARPTSPAGVSHLPEQSGSVAAKDPLGTTLSPPRSLPDPEQPRPGPSRRDGDPSARCRVLRRISRRGHFWRTPTMSGRLSPASPNVARSPSQTERELPRRESQTSTRTVWRNKVTAAPRVP